LKEEKHGFSSLTKWLDFLCFFASLLLCFFASHRSKKAKKQKSKENLAKNQENFFLVEIIRFELTTSALQKQRSTN
jgi:hypothetical protein